MLTLVDAPDDVDVAFKESMATATITDDDELTVPVQPQQDAMLEDSEATFTVMLTRAGADGAAGAGRRDVEVKYMVSGETENDADPVEDPDYELPSGTLTIPSGARMAAITSHDAPRRRAGTRRDSEGNNHGSFPRRRGR